MLRRICVLLILTLAGACSCQADVKDPRLAPISAKDLQVAIRQTPLTSAAHVKLLSRSKSSGLADLAYKEYSILWRSRPSNPSANLWRGMAALALWRTQKFVAPVEKDLSQNPFNIARSSLSKAYQLRPLSPIANMEYGFFLWQYDNQESKGLELLQKAKRIAFTDPRIHAYLALVCANPSIKSRNLILARDELLIALKLDNSYAFAHDLLSSVYRRLGQKQLSQLEEKKYLSLIP